MVYRPEAIIIANVSVYSSLSIHACINNQSSSALPAYKSGWNFSEVNLWGTVRKEERVAMVIYHP